MSGKQILDAALIANKVIDGLLKSGMNEILCKLDVEKEYDHLTWSFVFCILNRLAFGENLCSWIKSLHYICIVCKEL